MGTYTTVSGDTWDLIAYKVYGDEEKADVLMRANWNLLEYFVFPDGIQVNTPELEEYGNGNYPGWMQED